MLYEIWTLAFIYCISFISLNIYMWISLSYSTDKGLLFDI
jgi:hypothetical protein